MLTRTHLCTLFFTQVVTITGEHHHGNQRTFEFTQERFLSTGPVPDDQSTWMIPVGVVAASHSHVCVFVSVYGCHYVRVCVCACEVLEHWPDARRSVYMDDSLFLPRICA